MTDRIIIERLISHIRGYLGDLKPVKNVPFLEYCGDIRLQRFVERTLHIAIEACLDIGNHIISDEGYREPEDNRDVFRILGENGIIPGVLQEKLENMASFRNLIVHSYAKIDNEIVFGIATKRLEDLEAFIGTILEKISHPS